MFFCARFVFCLLLSGYLSAVTGMGVRAVQIASRRNVVSTAVTSARHIIKAHFIIAIEETHGPRDPFLPNKKLTPEEREFEVFLVQQRIALGLSPFTSKR